MRKFFKWFFLVVLLLVAAFFIFAPTYVEKQRNPVAKHTPYLVSEKAQKLHDSLLIGDLHADSLLWNRDLLKKGTHGHVDIPRLIEGNVALQIFTAVTKSPSGQNYDHNSADASDNITLLAIGQLWPVATWTSLFERAKYQAEKLHGFANQDGSPLKIILSKSDLDSFLISRANEKKQVAGLLGIEGAHALEGDLKNLDRLVEVGYRLIGLQHFFDNDLGGSLHGEEDAGLTEFGKQVVKAAVQKNLIIDVAHSSQQVARDVLAMTDVPIVVSHTGIHSHCKVKRNFPDALMKQIAASGGLVGIGYWADVTCDDSPKGVASAIKAAIKVVGEDHVSLGSDFDGAVPTAFDVSELAALTQAMLDAGITETHIRKVMGENMVRVLRAILK